MSKHEVEHHYIAGLDLDAYARTRSEKVLIIDREVPSLLQADSLQSTPVRSSKELPRSHVHRDVIQRDPQDASVLRNHGRRVILMPMIEEVFILSGQVDADLEVVAQRQET